MKRITIAEFRKLVSVHKLQEWIREDGGVEIVADGKVIAVVLDSVHIVEPEIKATGSVHKVRAGISHDADQAKVLAFGKERQAVGKMRRGG